MMAIQVTLPLVAVHEHPAGPVTMIVPLPPVAVGVRAMGVTVKVHGAPPWFTVNVWPAIVSVVDLALDDVFAAAVNATDPFPLPLLPLVIVTQESVLVAVQLHPLGAVTATDPESPVLATDWLAGEIVKLHVGPGRPSCVTVTVWLATIMVAVRLEVSVFAAM
jgi:hypothetical protein